MSSPFSSSGIASAGTVTGASAEATSGAATTSTGSSSATPFAARASIEARTSANRSGSTSEPPTSAALRGQQRERHGAADQEGVDPVEERVDHRELVRDLRAAEDRRRTAGPGRAGADRARRPRAGAGGPPRRRGRSRASAPAARAPTRARGGRRRMRRRRRRRPAPRAARRRPDRRAPRPGRTAGSRAARTGASRQDLGSDVGDGDHLVAEDSREARTHRREAELGWTSPFGRPRCDASTTEAPRSRSSASVGHDRADPARRRPRAPSGEGNVEVHADEHTRPVDVAQPLAASAAAGSPRRGDDLDQVDQAVRVAPLVVVPAHHLDEVAHRHRERRVERARRRRADDVGGDDRVLGYSSTAASGPRSARRGTPRSRPRPSPRGQQRREVGDRSVGDGHPHATARPAALHRLEDHAGGARGAGGGRDRR